MDKPFVGSCPNNDSSNGLTESPFNNCVTNGISSEPEISSLLFNLNFHKGMGKEMCEASRNTDMALNKSELVVAGTTESTALELKVNGEKHIQDQQMNISGDDIMTTKDNSSANTVIDEILGNFVSVCEEGRGKVLEMPPISKLKDDAGNLIPAFPRYVAECTYESYTKIESNNTDNKIHPDSFPQNCKSLKNCPSSSSVSQSCITCLYEVMPFGSLNKSPQFVDLWGINQFSYDSKHIPTEDEQLNKSPRFVDLCEINQFSNDDSKHIPTKAAEMSAIASDSNNEFFSIARTMEKMTLGVEDKLPEMTLGVEDKLPEMTLGVEDKLPEMTLGVEDKLPEMTLGVEDKLPGMALGVEDKLPHTDHVTSNFADVLYCGTTDTSINESTSASDTERSSGISFPKHGCYSETSSFAYDDLSDSMASKLSTSSNSLALLLGEDSETESENSDEEYLMVQSSTGDSFSDDQRNFRQSNYRVCENCEHLLDTSYELVSEDSYSTWDESRSFGTSASASSRIADDENSDGGSSSSYYDSSETNSSDSDSSED